MDADEARAQLALTDLSVPVSTFDRSWPGIYLVLLGLAGAAALLLMPHFAYSLLLVPGVAAAHALMMFVRPARALITQRWILIPAGLAGVGLIAGTIWSPDSAWLSACLFAGPIVIAGLVFVWLARE